ncbi:MAG: C39 family peptidase [Oscillospiraceae bacterium]|nr:C39 family peptidase [Oscillospiraceae bacterium]
MNELITRLAVIVICVAVLAAVVAVFILGREDDGDSIPDDVSLYTEQITEAVSVSETAAETTAALSVSETKTGTESETTTVPSETSEISETSSSRTIITSRVRKEYDNNAVYIDMENILQLPELPVGCEITALTIMLKYCGFDADKTVLARDYLPLGGYVKEEDGKVYKDSFFDYFIGDPFSRGYGCFSNAIEKAANKYIADNGGGYTVYNISGAHPDLLYDYLAQGIPVICWATDGMIEPEFYESWYDSETGEKLDWYINEHCFVLAGFNMDGNFVTLNDPMKGIIDYNINKFETRYRQMNSQAIVILKDGVLPIEAELTETVTTAMPVTEATEAETVSETTEETTEISEDTAE